MELTVIIPTRNRVKLVDALLDSMAHLEPVKWDWEVIVVDNGSTDNTAEMVRQKQNQLSLNIRYILEERPGLHQGRNRGATEADGKYLAYLDDDMLLAPSWLQGVNMLQNGTADAVVGRIIPKWETSPPKWILQMYTNGALGLLALLDLGEKPVETTYFYGCNLFISRKTVLDLGGFNPDGMPENLIQFRGDGETGLWLKMCKKGMSLWYSPSAIAYHIVPESRMTIEYLKKRAFNQGISESFTYLRIYHGLYENPIPNRPIFVHKIINWLKQRHIFVYLRYVFRHITNHDISNQEKSAIQYELAKSYATGWKFHRKKIKEKRELLKYILSISYLEN